MKLLCRICSGREFSFTRQFWGNGKLGCGRTSSNRAGGWRSACNRGQSGGRPMLLPLSISRTAEEIRRGAKSRYYPIELSAVIDQIRAVPGRYAVLGIPCFIKAINLLRAKDAVLRDRIAFTLGLSCGQLKSARMVESFAWQMGTDEIGRATCREGVCL